MSVEGNMEGEQGREQEKYLGEQRELSLLNVNLKHPISGCYHIVFLSHHVCC
jgi:hypothetical protein